MELRSIANGIESNTKHIRKVTIMGSYRNNNKKKNIKLKKEKTGYAFRGIQNMNFH